MKCLKKSQFTLLICSFLFFSFTGSKGYPEGKSSEEPLWTGGLFYNEIPRHWVDWKPHASSNDYDIYSDIRNALLHVRTLYPTSEYYHVYVGRSLGGLAAAEMLIDPGSASNLPYSGAHLPGKAIGSRKNDEQPFEPLTQEQEERLFQHFDRFFPKREQLAGRKIVFMDFSWTGPGLKSALTYLSLYVESRRLDVPFEAYALGEIKVSADYKQKALAKMRENIIPDGSSITLRLEAADQYPGLDFGLLKNRFDDVAQYGRYNPGKDKAPVGPRRSFQMFQYRLLQRMRVDPILRASLKGTSNMARLDDRALETSLSGALTDLQLIDEAPGNAVNMKTTILESQDPASLVIKILQKFHRTMDRGYTDSEILPLFIQRIVSELSPKDKDSVLDWILLDDDYRTDSECQSLFRIYAMRHPTPYQARQFLLHRSPGPHSDEMIEILDRLEDSQEARKIAFEIYSSTVTKLEDLKSKPFRDSLNFAYYAYKYQSEVQAGLKKRFLFSGDPEVVDCARALSG